VAKNENSDLGDLKMNENETKQNNLLDTTDCLEAVGVFRGWKNFFFAIALLCLLVLQLSFWLVNTGYVKAGDETKAADAAFPAIIDPPGDKQMEIWPPPAKELVVPLQEDKAKQSVGKLSKIEKAAEEAFVETNKPVEEPQPVVARPRRDRQQTAFLFGITFKHLFWTIRIVNGLLILTAVLHCLSMLFSLKISLLGRLGGINHISRAFFLSLIMVVLLLLGQISFGHIPGAIYTPDELLRWHTAETTDIFGTVLYYLRFSGYWLLVFLLLILSQLRSSRWAKAVLRRLEVI